MDSLLMLCCVVTFCSQCRAMEHDHSDLSRRHVPRRCQSHMCRVLPLIPLLSPHARLSPCRLLGVFGL